MARRARYRYQYTYKRRLALKRAQKISAQKRKRMALGVLGVGVAIGAVYAGSKVYKRNNGNVGAQVQDVTPPAAKPDNAPLIRHRVGPAPSVGSASAPAQRMAAQTMGHARVMVTGSRDWADAQAIEDALEGQLVEHGAITLVHGAARGADSIADKWARRRIAEGAKIHVERYPANWNKYGKRAGPLRNQKMVDLGADVVLGFPIAGSVGTRHAMKAARKAGIRVIDLG
jgi:hypothetical protein